MLFTRKGATKMIRKIFSAGMLFTLGLACSVGAYSQVNPTPSRPGPVKGLPTGTKNPTIENIITSKLAIFTKNGKGTTSTSTGGEFGAQLAASAAVDCEFSLEWSRSSPGKAESGQLYIRAVGNPDATPGFIPFLPVNLPAQSIVANIGVTMPTPTPGTYELKVIGSAGSSTKVTVNFTGAGGSSSVVISSNSSLPKPAAKGSISIIGAIFSPAVGAPGAANYKPPKLTLTLRASETTIISSLEVEVWSQTWTNSELLTSSSSKNSPIMIFRKKVKFVGGTKLAKDKLMTYPVVLRRTTKGEVEEDESGPGFYSPADWSFAFAQSKSASFRWKVDNQLVGSSEQSPNLPWKWGAP
jgi:hypothetical protein